MLYEDLLFENNDSGKYYNSITQLVQLEKNINVKCHNIIINHNINVIYDKNSIYIPINREFDIIFNISNIDNEHIIKKELYGTIFYKICNIEYNNDFILPIHLISYTEIYVKITFDNISNIPKNINLTYTGGLLQTEYRKNCDIIYPLSSLFTDGCIIPTTRINKINIIIKSYEYTFNNGMIYKLLSKFDHDIKLIFGEIIIETNLLKIDNIPCIAQYDSVKIVNNSNSDLELDFFVNSPSDLEDYKECVIGDKEFVINDKHIIMTNGIYIYKEKTNYSLIMNSLLELEGFQSIIISQDNNIIFEYGDIKYNHGKLASCRKSILAILYGIYDININKTLKELNIDDKLGLSDIEKIATIKNLLSARSGIYHPASNGGDDNNKPERYSKKPGEYFTYNNWDFNALGTIFVQETGINIYDALDNLGKQINFEDFDVNYNKEQYNKWKEEITDSIHPSYHMYLSARDMLKIGNLMLNEGKYNEKQIVPKEWIKEMVSLHTEKCDQGRLKTIGYGYMWWVFDENEDHPLHKTYMAQGAEGQSIIVIPNSNMVIITKNYTKKVALLNKIFNLNL